METDHTVKKEIGQKQEELDVGFTKISMFKKQV